ncbi:MAG: sulfate transporter substrate-binding protein [Mycobacterium sp.]|nr:sulfate transporter substrate-binding protein [Mycobacterium sp.]
MTGTRSPARRWHTVVVTAVLAALVAACSDGSPDAEREEAPGGGRSLSVLAFTSSAPGWDAGIPAFGTTEAGADIGVQTTYGPSAELAQSILDGAAADVVYLADQPNLNRLVQNEKVAADWNAGPFRGQPFGSVSTLVVREGNPLNIQTWPDLLRPGVEVVAANPVLSGSGKWGLLAAYASASAGGQNEQAGVDYLTKLILEHIVDGPATVAEAVELFLAGSGDVLITAENTAIDAQRRTSGVEIVIPPQTLRIDNQVAVLRSSSHPAEAAALVNFLYTPEAQRLWAAAGFRPALPEIAAEFAADFRRPQKLWTIDEIGGWARLDPKMYDPENGIITRIFEQATG